jgi:hypothetical protein
MIYPYPSLRQGLVGAWCPSLGATGYILLDRSGYRRNGALTNMGGQQNWVASGTGTALQFDGVNDFVSVSWSTVTGSVARTLSHWFAYTSTTNANWVSFGTGGTGNLWQTGHFNGNVGSLNSIADVTTSATPYIDGRWHHIATQYDGATVLLYLDGKFISSAARTINTGSSALRIGSGQGSGFAVALLDDVRVYNRVLTRAEIRLLASRRGIGLTPSGSTRATYTTRFQIRVGGTWREADAYQNVGGVWKPAKPSIKVAGVWK